MPIIPAAINRCTRFACKLDDSSKPTTGHRFSLAILRASALSATSTAWNAVDKKRNKHCSILILLVDEYHRSLSK